MSNSNITLPAYSEFFNVAWKHLSQKLGLYVALSFVVLLGSISISIVTIVGSFASAFFFYGYINCVVVLRENKDLKLIDFFWSFASFNRFLQIIFLYVSTWVLILIGYIFFIIPGIYISIGLALSSQVFLFKKEDAIYAIQRSLAIVRGRWWYFFGFMFFVMIVIGVGFLFFGIGGLFSLPLGQLMIYEAFKYFDQITPEHQSTVLEKPSDLNQDLNPEGLN